MSGGITEPIPPLRLPEPVRLFEGRSDRLRNLAREGGTDAYLAFLALLAAAQRAAVPEVPPPPAGATAASPASGPARPLPVEQFPRDPGLRPVVAAVARAFEQPQVPQAVREFAASARNLAPAALAELADGLLQGEVAEDQSAFAPFVGAAIQVLAAVRASRLDAAAVPAGERGCPVCGAPPVAGRVHADGGLRYLTCAVCSTEWHLPRIHCARCGATEGLKLNELENAEGVRAETCQACMGYVKLVYLEKVPAGEPVADDAATLTLDMHLGEAGYARLGPNLLAGA